MINSFKEAIRDFSFCAWCGIEMKWKRVLLFRVYCVECSRPFPRSDESGSHSYHSRVGMSQR